MSSVTVIEFGPVVPLLDFSGNEIRENEKGGSSATYGEEDKFMQSFGWQT
jgi:hypothetical protein